MKKILLSTVAFIFSILFCNAQSTYSIAEYMNHAKTAEKAGMWVFAADEYMQAARLHLEEADKSTLKQSVYSHLKAARECYNKAAGYYRQKLKLREEDDARQRIAIIDMTIALKGLEGLDYDDNKIFEDEKNEENDKNQVPYQQGGDVFFIAKKTTFIFNPPKAMKYNGVREQKTETSSKSLPTLINMYGMQDGIRISLKEYVDDDKDGKRSSTEMCDNAGSTVSQSDINSSQTLKVMNQLGAVPIIKYQELQLDFGKVCLVTKETTQMGTKRKMFSFTVSFYYNGSGYLFEGVGPIEWRNAFMSAIKTFRISQAKQTEETKCSGGESQPLESKAFYDSYYLPDPSGKATITITPVLQRNKVPSAWHDIITATRKAVAQIPGGEVTVETKSDEMNDGAEKIIMYLNNLGFEAITPQKVADAYLAAFDKVIYGIEGLEASITNMSVNFSFSVPFIEIRTKCVPQIVCSNNKWQPDYKNLVYEKLFERKAVEKYSRDFMTMKQVRDAQQNLLGKFLEKLEDDKKKYESASKCERHIFELREVDFGVMPGECRLREAKLAALKEEQSQLNEEKKYYEDDLAEYKKSKPGKLGAIKNAIIEIDKRIAAKNKELSAAQELKKNYESNPDKENPEKTKMLMNDQDEKINAIKDAIRELNNARKEYVAEQNSMNANKFENDIQKKINSLNTRLNQLKTEIPAAQKAVAACKK
jgi:hypothetical protein